MSVTPQKFIEMIPSSFISYESYAVQLCHFLNTYETCFVNNVYDDNHKLIHSSRFTRVLIDNSYQNIPLLWRSSFFDKIHSFVLDNPSFPIWDHLIALIPSITTSTSTSTSLKSLFPYPDSLLDFINAAKKLYPIGNAPPAPNPLPKVGLMSQKKAYECQQLIQALKDNLNGCIIDVGSGKGYLIHELLKQNIPAIGVEGNPTYVTAMQDRVNKLKKQQSKKFVNTSSSSISKMPQAAAQFLPPSVTPQEFLEIVGKLTDAKEFMLTSLHACGDLTPTMLRLAVRIPQIRSVCAVGCCYHKLSDSNTILSSQKQTTSPSGFPMSNLCQNNITFALGHSETSTFPAPQTLSKENYYELFVQQSRKAAFEYFMYKQLGSTEDHPTGNAYNVALLQGGDFYSYVVAALKNIKKKSKYKYADKQYNQRLLDWIDQFVPTTDLNTFYDQISVNGIVVQSATLIILSAIIAPVIESLVVVDRVLYLKENGADACAREIFDPSVSPRRYAIFAKKQDLMERTPDNSSQTEEQNTSV
ncbi:Methyltransferase domain-containing protein [Entamoeba marina]